MTTVVANNRAYRVPDHPVVVITVDGGDPGYFHDGLARGIMPRLQRMLDEGGVFSVGASEIPNLTKPNNISIVTGVPPAIHGIPGNYCRTPEDGLVLLNDAKYLRAPSIHACFEEAGGPTLMVTTKDKLRRGYTTRWPATTPCASAWVLCASPLRSVCCMCR
ncbi:alkaline phosphatase family protein [Rhodococcus marinonascens]|uniref:alkaline phosphatase family protein n=1 Tax=Rhodococcus marinonascens TaxID=38311 RepID=UPI000934787A|nr:alkaline phosphatase family protein [Rhodococcus marinonascens]